MTCRQAVTAFLDAETGTIADIVVATRYSRSTVETAITKMRRDRAPELANLKRQRALPGTIREPVVRPEKPDPQRPPVDTSSLIASALASRNPLELAWSA